MKQVTNMFFKTFLSTFFDRFLEFSGTVFCNLTLRYNALLQPFWLCIGLIGKRDFISKQIIKKFELSNLFKPSIFRVLSLMWMGSAVTRQIQVLIVLS